MIEIKQWYRSKTVWGALIAIFASIMQFFGVTMDESEQMRVVDAAMTIAGAIGGLLALYGRVSANAVIKKQ